MTGYETSDTGHGLLLYRKYSTIIIMQAGELVTSPV